MKAIILAAGRGSRMGNLTDERPKCLTVLSGETLLTRQMTALRAGGADEIAIVTGYKNELLRPFSPTTFDNPRWAQTNMVSSLVCAGSWLEAERCIVSYSDIFYEPSAVSALIASDGDICITYDINWLEQWSRRFEDPLSDAEQFQITSDSILTKIGGRATSVEDIQGQYMGLLAFTPRGWNTVTTYLATLAPEVADKLDMTGLLARLIATGARIKAVPYRGAWGEVDSATDLALFEKMRA